MMKRETSSDDKKVRDALEACYSQLDDRPSLCCDIIREVRGEGKVKKKITIRTVLVTALLVLLIAGIALATTSQMTLGDFLKKGFSLSSIPQEAENVLAKSGTETYTLGRVKFTRQEIIADGKLLQFTTKVESLDENVILFPMEPEIYIGDMSNTVGERPVEEALAEAYGVEYSSTILEAAQAKQLKIYGVSVSTEFLEDFEYYDESFDGGGGINQDESYSYAYQMDCSVLLVNRVRLDTDKRKIQIGYNYCFTEYDPLTGEVIEETVLSETDIVTVPVQPVLGVRTFTALDDQIGNDIAYVERVTLTQRVTGVYVETHLMVKDGVDVEERLKSKTDYFWMDMDDDFVLLDDAGEAYEGGMYLTGSFGVKDYPQLQRYSMLNMESMPDHLTIGILSEDKETIAATYTMTEYTDEK